MFAYVSRMWPQVGPMLALCWPKLALCWPYVGHILALCRNTAFFPFRGAPRTSRSFSSSNLAQLTPMLALACPYVGPICPLCCPSLDPMFTLSCPYVDPIWLLSWPYLGLRLPRVVDPSIACPYVSPILPLWWPYLSPMLPRAYLSSMLPLA